MKLKIELLNEECKPKRAFNTDAGLDLKANIDDELIIKPNEKAKIPLGIKTKIEPGYFAQLHSRSGLSTENQLILLNSVGVIDANWRGEWVAIMKNLSNEPITIKPYERVVQAIFQKLPSVELEYGKVSNSDRGEGGFGSTGKN